MGNGLALRSARKHVHNLSEESNTVIVLRYEPKASSREYEVFVQLCLDAYDWLLRAEECLIEEENRGICSMDGGGRETLLSLHREWLPYAKIAYERIRENQRPGFDNSKAAALGEYIERAEGWVKLQQGICDNTLPNEQLQIYADHVAGLESLPSK